MLDEVTGGTIYYKADGSAIDGVGKYKLEGIMKNGRFGRAYSDDVQELFRLADLTGISKDLIKID